MADPKKYVLIETQRLETLLRNDFVLAKTVLAFEYLCQHSDRPMYLRAEGVCEVLGITAEQLDECRIKRIIPAKVFQRQMMYNLYDLVTLAEKLNRRKLQRALSRIPEFRVED